MVTNGVSASKVKRVAQSMGIDRMSASQVSRMCSSLDDTVADLQERDPSDVRYPYIWLDATQQSSYPSTRRAGRCRRCARRWKAARQGYYAWKSRPPTRTPCARGACLAIPSSGTRFREHLRRAQDARAAALAHDAHLAQARGPHHARARMARSHARASSVPRSTNAPPRGSPQTTWSSAGSRPAAQTRRGSRTSPTSKPARAGCIWRS